MAKSSKKIAVIGAAGYVGYAMIKFFCNHYETLAYDISKEFYNMEFPKDVKKITNKEDLKADVSVLCLPTAQLPNGRCDTSLVEEVVSWIETPLIIIKSTVEPGTTDKLKEKYKKRICVSPEYVSMSTYASPYSWDTEVKDTPWFTFGGNEEDTKEAVEIYMPICGPSKQYIQTSAKNAEYAKYMENTFYAMKVTFCYEMEQMCQREGLDYNKIREVWLADNRISKYHTSVFATNDRPFGGRCVLPESKVKINTGDVINISKLYDNWTNNKISKLSIESCNSDLTEINYKDINLVTKTSVDEELIVFETEQGEFTCTEEHLMPIQRNGRKIIVMAKDIQKNDLLLLI